MNHLLARRLKPGARRCAAAAGLRCSSELARSSDRRAGVRRESRCGVVGELAYRSPYYGTTPLRLGTLGGLMKLNVSYIFTFCWSMESWFLWVGVVETRVVGFAFGDETPTRHTEHKREFQSGV